MTIILFVDYSANITIIGKPLEDAEQARILCAELNKAGQNNESRPGRYYALQLLNKQADWIGDS